MELIASEYAFSSDEDDSPLAVKDDTLEETECTREKCSARVLGPSLPCGVKRSGEGVSSSLMCSQEWDRPLPSVGGYVSKRKRRKKVEDSSKQESSLSTPQVSSSELADYLSREAPNDHRVPSSSGSGGERGSITTPSSLPCRPVFTSHHHSKPVTSVQFHPNASMPLLLTASHDGKVCIWDWYNRKKLIGQFQSHGSHMTSSSPAPDIASVQDAHWLDDHHIISGGYDKRVLLTEATKGAVLQEFTHTSFVSRLAVHPDNSRVFVSGEDAKRVTLWDIRAGGSPVSQFKGVGGRVLDMAFLGPGGKEVVASSDIVRRNATSQTLVVWDVSSTVPLSNQIYQEPYTCPCVRAHPTDSSFLVQSNGDYIIIFSSSRPYKLNKYKRFEGHSVGGYPVQFGLSPDGGVVASGDENGRLVYYSYHTGRQLKEVPVSARSVEDPCVSVAYGSSGVGCGMWDGGVTVLA